jgi:hypothetical protein
MSVSASASRALIRELGTTAWTVLLDVSLDTRRQPGGRTAKTSVRLIADHLGVTPGTAARALARLTAAGLVQRQDRRDGFTGRFVESVYIVAPRTGIVPCVDCPHTAERHTAGWPVPATDRSNHQAGQRLPEGMASVCRPLGGGAPLGGESEDEVAAVKSVGADRHHRDGQGVMVFGRRSGSC